MRLRVALANIVWLLSAAGPGDVRDWTKNPALVQIDTAANLFAVGDAHGDYARLARALDGTVMTPSCTSRAMDRR